MPITTVPLHKGNVPKNQLDEPACSADRAELMSLVGTQSWIVRMCRPGHTCTVSQLQSAVAKPTVADLVKANQCAAELQATSDKGITYKRGVDWHDCVVAAVSDAGHANAEEYLSDWDVREPFRSQGGKLIFLAQPCATTADTFSVVLISFSSNTI